MPMRRDQLKILLSGILVLLLGSLILYSYLFREDISKFLKKKEGEEVSNNSKTDRVILSPDMNTEPPLSPNDLNTLPTEEKNSKAPEEFSGMEKEKFPSKETKSLKEEWPEEKKTTSPSKPEKEKYPEEKWNPPKDDTSTYKDEEPKSKKERMKEDKTDWEDKAERKHSLKKKKYLKKHSSRKTGKRIRSLETRVNRLEKKLGISSSKKKGKSKKVSSKRSLEKRVEKLEREMKNLKSKE
jgi:hypothetical protein